MKDTKDGLAFHSLGKIETPCASAPKDINPSLVSSFASNFSTDWTPRSGIPQAKTNNAHAYSSREVLTAGKQLDPLTNSHIDMDFEPKLLTIVEPLSFYSNCALNDLGYIQDLGPEAPVSLQSIDLDEENLDFAQEEGKKVSDSMPLFNSAKTKASIDMKNYVHGAKYYCRADQQTQKRSDLGTEPTSWELHPLEEWAKLHSATALKQRDGFRGPPQLQAAQVNTSEDLTDLYDSGVNIPRRKYMLQARFLSKDSLA